MPVSAGFRAAALLTLMRDSSIPRSFTRYAFTASARFRPMTSGYFSLLSACPMITTRPRGSCLRREATSSRHALSTLLRRALFAGNPPDVQVIASPDLDSSIVIVHRLRVGMREDDRFAGNLEYVHCRPVAGVAAVDDHAHPIHLLDHRHAKTAETAVGTLVTTIAHPVLGVVGHEHVTHAQLVVEAHHVEVASKRVRTLKVERDSQLSFSLGAANVGDISRDDIPVSPFFEQAPFHGKRPYAFLEVLTISRDRERDETRTCA